MTEEGRMREGFQAELRGPDGRVKETRQSAGPPPSNNGPVNVVEVVKLLLFRKLEEKFRHKNFCEEIIRASRQEAGTETQIAIYLCLEPAQLGRVCRSLLKARLAYSELQQAVKGFEIVKVH